jgi:L-lactate dehydrogenase complex protein LldG
MTSPRERILASIRDGLLRSSLPADVSGETSRAPAPPATLPVPELIERFSAVLTALSGHTHRAAGAPDVADTIAGIARAHKAASFISWDDEHLGCPGLLAALSSRGLTRVTYDVSDDPERRAREVEALAGIGLGVTGAYAALAENGGLVLVSGPGRGRLASLLPPVHVAVVGERRLRPSLAELFREEPGLLDAGSNVVVVAGPSRTADIEMTLTHGVHGPKHVHVILTP